MDGIEGDFENEALLDLADGAEPLDGMGSDEAVEPLQFLVGETEIGLADRQQLMRVGPAAEGEVAIETGALSRAALGVHENAIGGERIAFPFVPEAGFAAGGVRAVAALQHHALAASIAGGKTHLFQRFKIGCFNQIAEVEAVGVELAHESLETHAALRPGESAQVLVAVEQDVVESNEG